MAILIPLAVALVVLALVVCLYASFSIRSSLFGRIIWRGRTDRNQIAITFDDGPHPQFTREILGILKDQHIPATFFLVGKKVEAFPDVAREILQAGHDVGFHGFTHRPLWLRTRHFLREEVEGSRLAFKRVMSCEPSLFRPPYGIRGLRIMQLAQEHGWKTIYWTKAGWDWRSISGEEVARRALKGIEAGSIILLHDGDGPSFDADRKRTVDALRIIIRELKDLGFSFAKVSDILPK